MHPTGIEPALKASEASVLSIRLQVQNYYKFVTPVVIIPYLELVVQ